MELKRLALFAVILFNLFGCLASMQEEEAGGFENEYAESESEPNTPPYQNGELTGWVNPNLPQQHYTQPYPQLYPNPPQTPGTGLVNGGLRPFLSGMATVIRRAVQAGRDLVRPLLTNPDRTAASVSTNCGNGAMSNEASHFRKLGLRTVARHGSEQQLLDNIRNLAPDTETLIVGTHGCPGQVAFLRSSQPDTIRRFCDAVLTKNGSIKRILFTSCSTGAKDSGESLVKQVAACTGAETIAWDKTLWAGSRSITVNSRANAVIGIPVAPPMNPGLPPMTPGPQTFGPQYVQSTSPGVSPSFAPPVLPPLVQEPPLVFRPGQLFDAPSLALNSSLSSPAPSLNLQHVTTGTTGSGQFTNYAPTPYVTSFVPNGQFTSWQPPPQLAPPQLAPPQLAPPTPTPRPGILQRIVQIFKKPVGSGQELLMPVLGDPKKTFASVSTNCGNGALRLEHANYTRLGIRSVRHTKRDEILANIRNAPPDTETFIVGTHGCSGCASFLDSRQPETIQAFCDAFKARTMGFIRKIIFTGCSSGAGSAGEALVREVSECTGAETIAWDKTLYQGSRSLTMGRGGHMVVAMPSDLAQSIAQSSVVAPPPQQPYMTPVQPVPFQTVQYTTHTHQPFSPQTQ